MTRPSPDRILPDSPVAKKVFPSPNHGDRKNGRHPDAIILHYTGMADAASALALLCSPVSDVSCHYFVFEDGHVLQLVPEDRRAWHAGRGAWAGETDMNSASIGIEIVNPGHDHGYPAFPDVQIEAVTALCADIAERWRIRPERILAHSDMAPARKRDPGEKFPWAALHEKGVGHLVLPVPIGGGRFLAPGDKGQPVEALQAMLALYGYPVDITGVFDPATEAVMRAFQRHFRQAKVDGVADASTIMTLRNLIAEISHGRSRPEAPEPLS
jgi:N-acetylmuramoyl-L-alanine amidase